MVNNKQVTASSIPVARRDPRQVMQLSRLGSLHQSRLSFMRQIIRRFTAEQWQFKTPVFDINKQGVGHAIVSAVGPKNTYSLVAFSHQLSDELRSDRVIAEAWDATFTLFDGVPTTADIDRLRENVPLQEAGRITESELTLSRANRSVRLWDHVVSSLANGVQPCREKLRSVGYLMRTTAVYGSGKFGAADREMTNDRPEFAAPFQIEMLTVYLIRSFVRDLVQHCAEARGGAATATLDDSLARELGVGNSTGLGMAPFILNHPELYGHWIMAREEAIARVRNVEQATRSELTIFRSVFDRACVSLEAWHSEHPVQIEKLQSLVSDVEKLRYQLLILTEEISHPWNKLIDWSKDNLELEAQEWLASLILEPYSHLVDGLCDCMAADEQAGRRIDGSETVEVLLTDIVARYDWVSNIDWEEKTADARAWYVSEEKLEPRLGERYAEPIAEYEQPLSPARDIYRLQQALSEQDSTVLLGSFLLKHPEHRYAVRRVQLTRRIPYAEILDNTIASDLMPIDMLRSKLSFFGAGQFDPRSDRWVRVSMFANAPYPDELQKHRQGSIDEDPYDLWPYPSI